MKIAVCIKQVPNRDYALSLDSERSWIREEGLAWEINEFDLYGVEAALQLKDRGEAEVVVFGLGPARVADALRKALAMGADRAVHLADDRIPRTSPYAAARALAAAIGEENPDLVITGVQSEDMAYFQTGALIAEMLAMESASMITAMEPVNERTFRLRLELEGGLHEEIEIDLPAVFLVQTGWNQPRYASLRGIMMAKKKPLVTKTLDDLGLAPEDLRPVRAQWEWLGLEEPVQETQVEYLEGTPEEIADALIEKLQKEAGVL